jgi:hypothetical protein
MNFRPMYPFEKTMVVTVSYKLSKSRKECLPELVLQRDLSLTWVLNSLSFTSFQQNSCVIVLVSSGLQHTDPSSQYTVTNACKMKYLISGMWGCIFWALVSWRSVIASDSIKRISIATLGDITGSSSISLSYVAPAIDTAMTKLRQTYTSIFNFSHTYLYLRNLTTAADLNDDSDIIAAEWFYKQQPQADLTVFISPG